MSILKQSVKTLFKVVAPLRYAEWKARRSRGHSEHLEEQQGCARLTRTFIDRYGSSILRGPFQGVSFVPETYHRHIVPKLMGAYEEELDPIWSRVFRKEYDTLLNVGAADGAYAVGLAQRYPDARVIAFDTDPWAREVLSRMRRHNDVPNLSIEGACLPGHLPDVVDGRTFVLSDCEGFEARLFGACPRDVLNRCDLLIELHETAAPGVTAHLSSRLADTHRRRFVIARPSCPDAFPETSGLPEDEKELAVSDLRCYPQQWLFAEAR